MPRPEQTERATPKRREEARKRGQIAKSQDLAGAAVFLAGVFVLHAVAGVTFRNVSAAMEAVLWSIHQQQDLTVQSVWMVFARAFGAASLVLMALFGAAVSAAVGTNVLQTGFLISLEPLKPSFTKISPVRGLQRLFSKTVLVNLGKQLLKLGA